MKLHMSLCSGRAAIGAILVCWLIAVTSMAQAPAQGDGGTEPLRTVEQRMKATISVDFKDAPIADVIKALSEQGNINVILSPKVDGKVTAKFTDVSLDEAMENILSVHGFGYVTTESIVRILPLEELEQQHIRLINKIHEIVYADLTEVAEAVKGLLSPNGQMAVNAATNHIMISDVEARITLIDAFIEQADREVPQILVEARVYDVSFKDSLDLGVDWNAGTFTLFDATTGLATTGKVDPFFVSGFSSSINQALSGDGGLRLGYTKDSTNLDLSFEAVNDQVQARLLASPKVLVLNNEQASIKIVREIPYQELTQSAMGGNIGTTKFKDVGVELIVTPRVTRDNKVHLDINPIFSVQTGSVNVVLPGAGEGSPQPIVDKREAHTKALVPSGQTVVIGGLRKSEIRKEVSKIPLLADIPLLGALFQFTGEQAINSELVVFITPTIISGDLTMSASESEAFENTEEHLIRPRQPKLLIDGHSGRAASDTDN